MNNSELEKKLKAARGPVLPADYQAAFARTVLQNLRSSPGAGTSTRQPWLPRLAWGMATAACILIAVTIGLERGREAAKNAPDVLADAKLIQETLAMFPNRVRAIVRDERGINLVLSDEANVPVSPPIYVRICDGKNCSSLVTFSGQEIQIAGQKLTVLSEASGGIILEGNEFVWSSTTRRYANSRLRIEAKPIQTGAM